MALQKLRKKIYDFFDENIKPIILADGENVESECLEACKKYEGSIKWVVSKYGDTIRVSGHSIGFGYLFFMIATPEDKDEYDFGAVYHGSRKEQS